MCEVRGGPWTSFKAFNVCKAFVGQTCLSQRLGCGVILRFILVELGRDLMKHTLRKVLWFW